MDSQSGVQTGRYARDGPREAAAAQWSHIIALMLEKHFEIFFHDRTKRDIDQSQLRGALGGNVTTNSLIRADDSAQREKT